MHCLNWILALTFLHYVTAAPTKTGKEMVFSTLILQNIEKLKTATCLSNDSTFYSVSSNQHDSIETALCCASEELKTVAGECFSSGCTTEEMKTEKCLKAYCLQTSEFIQKLMLTPKNAANPECTKCEVNPAKSYKEFLSDLETLVRKFNAKQDTSS